MKRIIACGLAVLCAAPVAASTICAEDDVIAIILDPTINKTSSNAVSINAELMEWGTTFPYGSIWGVAACIGVAGSTGSENLTDSNGELVVGGERTGKYCWCQMRHPVRSRWVFLNTYGSADACRTGCVNYCGCGSNVSSCAQMWLDMFGSVGN